MAGTWTAGGSRTGRCGRPLCVWQLWLTVGRADLHPLVPGLMNVKERKKRYDTAGQQFQYAAQLHPGSSPNTQKQTRQAANCPASIFLCDAYLINISSAAPAHCSGVALPSRLPGLPGTAACAPSSYSLSLRSTVHIPLPLQLVRPLGLQPKSRHLQEHVDVCSAPQARLAATPPPWPPPTVVISPQRLRVGCCGGPRSPR